MTGHLLNGAMLLGQSAENQGEYTFWRPSCEYRADIQVSLHLEALDKG